MNMIDYIKRIGDKTFDIIPFNEIDNTILCQIAYVPFEKIINTTKTYTIEQLSSKYFSIFSDKDIKKDRSLIAKSPLVLKEAAKVDRYKDIIMHHFKMSFDEKDTRQFVAMQFDLLDGTTYVSFRGTDDSILGWKEDFQMAYRKIKSFDLARRYINIYCSIFKKYRIGGHSKGGSLALYATLNCWSFKRSNIIEIYSNDGPGIKDEFIGNKLDSLKCRFVKIVPQDDIIGLIFDDDRDHLIVDSDAVGLFQHDMLSWKINDLTFEVVKSLSNSSIKIKESINKYINSVPKNEVEHVTNSLFIFFKSADITKVSELLDPTNLKKFKLFKNSSYIDDKTLNILFNIMHILIKNRLFNIFN